MAATLVLNNDAKTLVVHALKEDLQLVFLAYWDGNVSLDATLTDQDIRYFSSDGSSRVKNPRLNAITTEYRTENDLVQNDESRITNFYMDREVGKLVLMDMQKVVKGIITFPTIAVTETKSLYVPQIKINVL